MIALTAYIAWLSRGARVGEGFPNQGLLPIHQDSPPDTQRGAQIYEAKCMMCHGLNGDGRGVAGTSFPPLWGPRSFAHKAGMSRIEDMAPFVKYTMPANNPNSMTAQEAFDVAAFVLSHSRPRFDPNRVMRFKPVKAGYF